MVSAAFLFFFCSLLLYVSADHFDRRPSTAQDQVAPAPEIWLPVVLRQMVRELLPYLSGRCGLHGIYHLRKTGLGRLQEDVDVVRLICDLKDLRPVHLCDLFQLVLQGEEQILRDTSLPVLRYHDKVVVEVIPRQCLFQDQSQNSAG